MLFLLNIKKFQFHHRNLAADLVRSKKLVIRRPRSAQHCNHQQAQWDCRIKKQEDISPLPNAYWISGTFFSLWSFLEAWPLKHGSLRKQKARVQKQRGETPRTPSPSGKFFTKLSITNSENESKLLQSCIQSAAARDKRQQESCADLVSRTEKASVLAEMQLGSWWAAKGHLHRPCREEARFQNKNRPAYAVLTWKIKEDDAKNCKRKETFLANLKEHENFIKRKQNSRFGPSTLFQFVPQLSH